MTYALLEEMTIVDDDMMIMTTKEGGGGEEYDQNTRYFENVRKQTKQSVDMMELKLIQTEVPQPRVEARAEFLNRLSAQIVFSERDIDNVCANGMS